MDRSVKSKIMADKEEGGKEKKTETGSSTTGAASVTQGSRPMDWKPQEVPSATSNQASANSLFALSDFDISTIIQKKFSGAHSEFPEFSLRLQLADKQMALLGYHYSQRFLHLLKVLEGFPYMYVKDLPLTSEDSYGIAISTLTSLYTGHQSVYKDAIIQALKLPKSTADYSSRSQLHSGMVSFFNVAMDQNKTAEEAFFGLTITIFESKCDHAILKEWYQECNKNRAPNAMGHNGTIEDLQDIIFRVMLQDLHAREGGTTTPTTPRVSWTRR